MSDAHRVTMARKTLYRQALLGWVADALEAPPGQAPPYPSGVPFGLSVDQARAVRLDIAGRLRHRADHHDGRLRS